MINPTVAGMMESAQITLTPLYVEGERDASTIRELELSYTDTTGTRVSSAKLVDMGNIRVLRNGPLIHNMAIYARDPGLYGVENFVGYLYVRKHEGELCGYIGIADLWTGGRIYGNIEPEFLEQGPLEYKGRFKLFSERFFGVDGPGVFPVPITESGPEDGGVRGWNVIGTANDTPMLISYRDSPGEL